MTDPIVLPDLHGRLDLLDLALATWPDRTYVLLGDYIDRGPDSPGVVRRVRELVEGGRAVALLGNHDLMMIQALLDADPHVDDLWRVNGGDTTLDNYTDAAGTWHAGRARARADATWMRDQLRPWHVHGRFLLAHAARPHPNNPNAHLWDRPSDGLHPLPDGLSVSVHGHTPLENAPVCLALPGDGSLVWYLDGGAVWTGRLCCLDLADSRPHTLTLP